MAFASSLQALESPSRSLRANLDHLPPPVPRRLRPQLAEASSTLPAGVSQHQAIREQVLSNTVVLPLDVETVSLKLTKEQAKLLEQVSKDRGFPSKSEFVRYALARALEDRLSVKTIEEVFEARRQIRAGKTIPLERLVREG